MRGRLHQLRFAARCAGAKPLDLALDVEQGINDRSRLGACLIEAIEARIGIDTR
jgi:hypothetical protein